MEKDYRDGVRELVRGLAAVGIGLVLVAACGSSKSDPEPVQVRPLLAECVSGATTFVGTPAIGAAAVLLWHAQEGDKGCPTGPAADGDGPLFTNADTQTVDGTAMVNTAFVDGAAGAFNALAAACFAQEATCPTGTIALTLNGTILAVARIQSAQFVGTLQFAFQTPGDAQAFADAVNSGR